MGSTDVTLHNWMRLRGSMKSSAPQKQSSFAQGQGIAGLANEGHKGGARIRVPATYRLIFLRTDELFTKKPFQRASSNSGHLGAVFGLATRMI